MEVKSSQVQYILDRNKMRQTGIGSKLGIPIRIHVKWEKGASIGSFSTGPVALTGGLVVRLLELNVNVNVSGNSKHDVVSSRFFGGGA